MIRTTALIAFVTVFLAASAAQTCREYVPNNDPKFGYKPREGPRCEGMYVSKVAAPALELISLTLGRIEFDRGANLQVSAPGYDRQIHVQGTAVPANTFYRMDVNSDSTGVFSRWPVEDVLGPQQIDAGKLAVLAWALDAKANNEKTYVPVRVTAGTSAKDDRIRLAVRLSIAAASLRWRWAPATINGGNWSCGKKDWQPQDKLGTPISPYQTVPITFPDLRGQVCVDIAALPQDSNDWIAKRYYVQASR